MMVLRERRGGRRGSVSQVCVLRSVGPSICLWGSVFGISSGSEESVVLNLRLIDSPERREWNAHNTINIMKSLSANPALRLF